MRATLLVMRTLRAFWHWVDHEKPTVQLYANKALDTLSELGRLAITTAEKLVAARTGHEPFEAAEVTDEQLVALRPATRDLSLAIGAALEHMHEQVEKDCLAPPRCPACHHTPCLGSHLKCNVNRYLAENRITLTKDEPIFRREYVADWLPANTFSSAPRATDEQLRGVRIDREAVERVIQRESPGSWAKMQQLANVANDTFRDVNCSNFEMQTLANLQPPGRLLGRALNDDGLAWLRPESTPRVFGQMKSHYNPVSRQLDLYTSIDVCALDTLRGLEPRWITIHGKADGYAPGVLAYLHEVVAPMLAPGTVLECKDPSTCLA
jgi:hypothetical protein